MVLWLLPARYIFLASGYSLFFLEEYLNKVEYFLFENSFKIIVSEVLLIMKNMKQKIIFFGVIVIIIVLMASVMMILDMSDNDNTNGNVHDHFNALEEWWIPIGASPNYNDEEHSFQTMVVGDLFGNDSLVAVSHYHHGQCGVFLNTNYSGTWEKEFLHPNFVRGTENSGGWPVKGLIGGDIDNDGYKEIVTCADVVAFPLEEEKYRPFPGVIFSDLNEPGSLINPQPLVWGNWGEEIASRDFSSLCPSVISPGFRSNDNLLSDIMVMTSTEYNDMTGSSRLFVLEQPVDGFNNYNYTYDTPTTVGEYPYDNEAFYVKHLYINNSGGVAFDMVFTPDQWHPQLVVDSSIVNGFGILDFNNDSLMDIAVSLEYWDEGTVIGSEIYLYKRVVSSNPNITYLFEEVDMIHSDGKTYSGMISANLDGDIENGNEALVLNSRGVKGCENTSIANYITIENSEMTLHSLDVDVDSSDYSYIGGYANTLVVDGNLDGFDDIIVSGVDKDSPFEEGYSFSDIIYFQNTGSKLSSNRFIYDKYHCKVLMQGQSPSWSLTMQQCDKDDELELVICVQNKLPYWEETEESEAHVYYCNLFDVITEQLGETRMNLDFSGQN